jgi:hypothetical protein
MKHLKTLVIEYGLQIGGSNNVASQKRKQGALGSQQ